MDGKRLITHLRLRNLLSYGPNGTDIELEPLNVLIGPNASGKSNLVGALSLLHAAPRDLLTPIRDGGGVVEWIWKGEGPDGQAQVEALVDPPAGPTRLRYLLAFTVVAQRLELVDEVIEDEGPPAGQGEPAGLRRRSMESCR